MGTFNDLRRVMEDTIRVDMKKRWTPQEVKFVNNKNEYFGTFHGKVDSTGATLTNVELSNATIYDDKGQKVEINSVLKLNDRVNEIEGSVDEVKESLNILSGEVQTIKASSTGIKDDLEAEIEDREWADIQLDKKISGLSNELSDEILDRVDADEEIYSRISEEVEQIDAKIETLDKKIDDTEDAINVRVDKEVSAINDTIESNVEALLSVIENDKHYKIVNVSTADRNYVLKDFAINNIEDTVSDGEVFDGDIAIGKISEIERDEEGNITSISLTTLRDINDEKIQHCFPANSTKYTMNTGNNFQTQVLDGYFMTFNKGATLKDSSFVLESHRTGGCDVLFNGEVVGAVVDDSYDTDGNLLSGRLELVPNPSSDLKAFNGKVFSFHDDCWTYVFEGPADGLSSKISVNPLLKAVTLKQNFSASLAIPLRNSLCSEVEVGRINYGEINKDSITARITKNVVESLTGTYVLSGDDFSVDIDQDNTIKYTDSKIRIFRKHNLFEYKTFSGTGTVTNATVVPNLENRVLGDGTFDEISVVVAEGEIPSFEAQTIVLKRDDNFTTTLKNDNTATISFNEADNTLKVDVAFAGGATFNKSYSVNKDERTMIENPPTIIVETQAIDVEHPAYEKTETSGENTWSLEIGEHQQKEYDDYPLNISIEKAGKLVLEFPKNALERDVSREFIARINLHGSAGFVELVIADDVELDNRDREDLFVKGDEISTIQFKQVGYKNGKPLYLVEDLKEHDLTHFIEELHREIEARTTADEELGKRIDNTETDIKNIYNKLSGIVNFKGSLTVNKDYSGGERQSGFAEMFMDNEFGAHDVLSVGWFYLVESSEEPLYKHTIDGVKVGKGDYLKIENSVVVEEIKLSDVLILDTLDGDVVHFDDLCAVSSDLDSKINTEKTNITNMSAYVEDTFVHLSGDTVNGNLSAVELCADSVNATNGTVANATITNLTAADSDITNATIDNLTVDISDVYFADSKRKASEICADIYDQIGSNDKDISNITLSVGNLSGLLESTVTSCNALNGRVDDLCVAISSEIISIDTRTARNEGDISEISTKIDGIVNFKGVLNISGDLTGDIAGTGFCHLFLENGYTDDFGLSNGWIYIIKSETEPIDNHHVDGVKVGSGDYLRINENTTVSGITKDKVSIADLFDSDSVHYDCLSAISSALSLDLSVERNNITNMSAYVDSICADIQSQVTANDKEISDITLSVGNLSGLLGTTATSCNALNGRVDDLCVAISSDVITLSTQVRDLCVAISTDVNTLSGDFHKIADYTFETPASELSSHITSYNLIITDEDHKEEPNVHDKYYLTFRDGTLVLVKKED